MTADKLKRSKKSIRHPILSTQKDKSGGACLERKLTRGVNSAPQKNKVENRGHEEPIQLPPKGHVVRIGSNTSSALAVKNAKIKQIAVLENGNSDDTTEETDTEMCRAGLQVVTEIGLKRQAVDSSSSVEENIKDEKRPKIKAVETKSARNSGIQSDKRSVTDESSTDDCSDLEEEREPLKADSSSDDDSSDGEGIEEMLRTDKTRVPDGFSNRVTKESRNQSTVHVRHSGKSRINKFQHTITKQSTDESMSDQLNSEEAGQKLKIVPIVPKSTKHCKVEGKRPASGESSSDGSSYDEYGQGPFGEKHSSEERKICGSKQKEGKKPGVKKQAKLTSKKTPERLTSEESNEEDSGSNEGITLQTIKTEVKNGESAQFVVMPKQAEAEESSSDDCSDEEDADILRRRITNKTVRVRDAKERTMIDAHSDVHLEGDTSAFSSSRRNCLAADLLASSEINEGEGKQTNGTAIRKRKSDGAADLSSKKRPHVDDNSHQPKGDEQRTVFCGGLPIGSTEGIIKEVFEESCGVVEYVKVLGNGGACFVCFEHDHSVAEAVKWHGSDYKGKALKINKASDKPLQKRQTPKEGCQVFVRNLSFKSTENSIRSAFSECGAVIDVWLPTGDDGRLRGFCKVTFDSENGAKAACEWTNTDLDGRTITVEMARPRGEGGGDRGRRGGAFIDKGRGGDRGGAFRVSGHVRGRGSRGSNVPLTKNAERDGTVQVFTGKAITFDSDSGSE